MSSCNPPNAQRRRQIQNSENRRVVFSGAGEQESSISGAEVCDEDVTAFWEKLSWRKCEMRFLDCFIKGRENSDVNLH